MATGMPLILFACFSGVLNFVSGLFPAAGGMPGSLN
jgi:hypothetical protein